jgi:hypothetical protein
MECYMSNIFHTACWNVWNAISVLYSIQRPVRKLSCCCVGLHGRMGVCLSVDCNMRMWLRVDCNRRIIFHQRGCKGSVWNAISVLYSIQQPVQGLSCC